MLDQERIVELLQEFFSNQTKDGLQERFFKSLNQDFDKIINDFNDFVTDKHLKMDTQITKVNFHEAVLQIIKEICALKLACIKEHTRIISESANRAKELSMKPTVISH